MDTRITFLALKIHTFKAHHRSSELQFLGSQFAFSEIPRDNPGTRTDLRPMS